jgi:uncharacterized membrane protein YhaH (DUF805 family)
MQTLHFLLSPSGRLRPRPFVLAVIVIYIAGGAAQWLTAPELFARLGLWPFGIVQAALIWLWFVLHAKRLHDAGHAASLAAGACVLYALGIVLLLVIGNSFLDKGPIEAWGAAGSSALGVLVLISIIGTLLNSTHYDVTWLFVAAFTVMALLPPIVALAVTVWAATRPSVAEQKM